MGSAPSKNRASTTQTHTTTQPAVTTSAPSASSSLAAARSSPAHALPPHKRESLRNAVALYSHVVEGDDEDDEHNVLLVDVEGVVGWVDRKAGDSPSVAAAVLRRALALTATRTHEGRLAVSFDDVCDAMFALSRDASVATKVQFVFRVICGSSAVGGGGSDANRSGEVRGMVREAHLAEFMQCVTPWLTPAAAATIAASIASSSGGGMTEQDVAVAIGEQELVARLTVEVV